VLQALNGAPLAKVISFNKDHDWQFVHMSEQGHLVLVDSLKQLYLLKWEEQKDQYELGGHITLPKSLSHALSESGKLFMFDKAGDIYSQTFEALQKAIEENDNKQEIIKDLQLETSEFCAMVSVVSGKLAGKEIVAISDQYYKIRLLEKSDFHVLLMSTSLRTRYAENLYCHREKRLLVYYDDGKMQLLDDNEIVHSLNIDTNYMCHPFVGKLEFFNIPKTDLLLVHCKDTHEIHLCEIKDPDLRITSLDKKKYTEGVLLLVHGHKVFVVRHGNIKLSPAEGAKDDNTGAASQVTAEVLSIDTAKRTLA
jgi:hypothetical protein